MEVGCRTTLTQLRYDSTSRQPLLQEARAAQPRTPRTVLILFRELHLHLLLRYTMYGEGQARGHGTCRVITVHVRRDPWVLSCTEPMK